MTRPARNDTTSRPSYGVLHRILVPVFFVLLATEILAPESAHAYIDPGSGSFILQGVIAGILGAGVALKMYWKRLFGRGRQVDEDDDDGAE